MRGGERPELTSGRDAHREAEPSGGGIDCRVAGDEFVLAGCVMLHGATMAADLKRNRWREVQRWAARNEARYVV